MWLPATGTCHIPCRAEKGSSSSSQAGDENASPRIPLLHLTGWVPGDVGVSTSMVCLPPQARLRFCASPRPAQPLPGSRGEFSTGAARLHSCTTLPKPGLQGEFLRSSGRLILGYADHYWSVSSLSENSSSSNVQDRPTYRAARCPRKQPVPKSVILFISLLLLDTYCLSGWAYIAE